MMRAVWKQLVFVASFLSSVACTTYPYALNDAAVCDHSGVVLKWMEENDAIIIHGKRGQPNNVRTCEIKFGPSSLSKKQVIKLMFDSYFVEDCGIYLVLQQSSSAFFEKDVVTMFNFTCRSTPGREPFYTQAGNNVRIYFFKTTPTLLNYNFILNMTLTADDGKIGGLSTAIMVGIGILIAIIIPGVGCVVYRYMKIKRWTKQHYESEGAELSAPSSHRHSHSHQSTPLSVRYSSLPMGHHEDRGPHRHSQTCIVGSRGTDGSCTVCGRIHDDFAHVVDVSSDNQIHDISSRDAAPCQICAENQQDFVYLVDTNGTTQVQNISSRPGRPNQPCPHRQNADTTGARPRIGGGRERVRGQLETVRGLIREDDDWDEGEDIDLSAHDLIPPSYDLSPPSYDEAVNMPKPENLVNGIPSVVTVPDEPEIEPQRRDSPDRDPLYQNLDTLTDGAS